MERMRIVLAKWGLGILKGRRDRKYRGASFAGHENRMLWLLRRTRTGALRRGGFAPNCSIQPPPKEGGGNKPVRGGRA